MRNLGKQKPRTLGQVNMDSNLRPHEDSTVHPSHDFSKPCKQYTKTRSILEAKMARAREERWAYARSWPRCDWTSLSYREGKLNLPLSCVPPSGSIQDLGHSFSQYGPPVWWITYRYIFAPYKGYCVYYPCLRTAYCLQRGMFSFECSLVRLEEGRKKPSVHRYIRLPWTNCHATHGGGKQLL